MEADFSSLPEIVWVKVMANLTLRDRHSLSLTCHALYSVFIHPSLWKTVKIFLLGGNNNFGPCKTFMSKACLKMIERFGQFFQDVTIKILGHIISIDSDTNLVIGYMAEKCRLETLTLEAGQLVSRFHLGGMKPQEAALLALVAIVSKACKLRKINVISWPMYPDMFRNSTLNIFEIMMKNEKIKNLESLSLFWNKGSWSERKPLLPSPSYVLRMIHHFRQLTHLALRLAMLDSSVMHEIAESNRAKLQLLQVFVDSSDEISHISTQDWQDLKRSCPELQVEVAIMAQVRHFDLSTILTPKTPLTSITFLKYSTCNEQLLNSLANMYHASLKDFFSHCQMSNIDESLADFTTKCNHLVKLVVTQELEQETVSHIKSLHEWSQLYLRVK